MQQFIEIEIQKMSENEPIVNRFRSMKRLFGLKYFVESENDSFKGVRQNIESQKFETTTA